MNHAALRRLALSGAIGATGLAVGISTSVISFAPPTVKQNPCPPLPRPLPDGVHKDGVEAIFNYQGNSVRTISTRRDGSSADGDLVGAQWSPERVLVGNGRDTALSLDVHGFELRQDARSQRIDYYDESAVIDDYYSACEELVRRATGAAIVVAFDHNVRCDSGKARGRRLRGGNRVEGTAALVHNDYTADAAARRLAMLAKPPTLLKQGLQSRLGGRSPLQHEVVEEALEGKRRFAFVNVWRPISSVECKPLGLVDATTTTLEELIPFQIHHADEGSEGGIYFAAHRPSHRWLYFPGMSTDEVLLLKQWDSDGGIARGRTDAAEGRATFALHSAFASPLTTGTDAPKDRESIEVRLVLVF